MMRAGTMVKITIGSLMLGALAATYVFLLNEEAKQQLKSSAQTVGRRVSQVQEKFDDLRGMDMDEDLAEQNRRSAELQWEALGY